MDIYPGFCLLVGGQYVLYESVSIRIVSDLLFSQAKAYGINRNDHRFSWRTRHISMLLAQL
jgi:hypothetical protein